MKTSFLLIATAITFFGLQSCNKLQETKVSSYNGAESHNMGKNCMECHKKSGKGEGFFTVAGTVYGSDLVSYYPKATIHLTSEPNGMGAELATIEVDSKGNFYTTQEISVSSAYATVEDTDGNKQSMNMKLTSGQCNSCHGVSTSVIHVPELIQ